MTILATLDVAAAARRDWDAIVVGAGPAGALAARELARWHCSVLLVDKAAFPRGKVCGCCLNGQALGVLSDVGLADIPTRLHSVPLRHILLAMGARSARVPLFEGLALSREAFDAALVDAAVSAGAHFLPRTAASLGRVAPETRAVVLQQGEERIEVTARLVLAADGLGNKLLHGNAGKDAVAAGSRIGAGVLIGDGPAFYGTGTIFMACGQSGYVGIVRVEDGRLDVACALDAAAMRAGGPGVAAAAIVDEAGLPPLPALAEAAWRGTPPLTRQAARLADERLFVLGDAAGYVEPFTGEGIAWALSSARAVVPLAVRAVRRWQPELAEQWRAQYRAIVSRRQWTCRALASVLRRPYLIGTLIGLLARWPGLAAPVVRRLHQPVTRFTGAGA